MSAAHRGAAALVPPKMVQRPAKKTTSPWSGSDDADTSGTTRHARVPEAPQGLVYGYPCCHDWETKSAELPPPPAPPPAPTLGPSFHTVSVDGLDTSLVSE